MSKGKSLAGKLLAPLIAAATSVAASFVAKKAPELVEEKLVPWLRDALDGAGGVTEKLPDKARSAVSTGGDLAGHLTDRVRDATGFGDDDSANGSGGSALSLDDLSQRSEDRAKRRAERRKATKT